VTVEALVLLFANEQHVFEVLTLVTPVMGVIAVWYLHVLVHVVSRSLLFSVPISVPTLSLYRLLLLLLRKVLPGVFVTVIETVIPLAGALALFLAPLWVLHFLVVALALILALALLTLIEVAVCHLRVLVILG
jgi:hypothetical protein